MWAIVANDIHAHKGKLISDQAGRLGLDSISIVTGDALDLVDRFEPASFDRILLDAPCSGLGVIRRKPDLKWGKSQEDIHEIAPQPQVAGFGLHVASSRRALYSTCTIEPLENEGVVSAFLDSHSGFGIAEDGLGDLSRLEGISLQREAGFKFCPSITIVTDFTLQDSADVPLKGPAAMTIVVSRQCRRVFLFTVSFIYVRIGRMKKRCI